MRQERQLKIGGCALRLEGDHPVLDLVLAELATARTDAPAEPDVVIRVGSAALEPPPASAVGLGPVTADGAAAWCRFPRTGFHAHFAPPRPGQPVEIDVAIAPRPMPFHIPRPLFRWVEPTFLTPLEAQAYVFMLRLLEGAVFLYGGTTALLHAACVEWQGRAVALTSAGGVGKTSTATNLLSRQGWRYLSDDMAALGPGGEVAFYPRWPMVYAYNLRHRSDLRRRVVAEGGWRGRLQWSVLTAAGVEQRRRRVSPGLLWGETGLGDRAELDLVVFLTRGRQDRLRVEEATATDLARRSRSIIAVEQATLGEIVRLWEAAGEPPVRLEEALDRHRRIYQRVFAGVRRLVHVRLPSTGGVAEAADAIEEMVRDGDRG